MNEESLPGGKRRFTLHCAALNLTVEFSLRPGEYARIGASHEMEITLPMTGLRDEECRLSRDDAGTLWLSLPGGGRVKSPGGFDAGPYFFEIAMADVASEAAPAPPSQSTPASGPTDGSMPRPVAAV